MNPSFDKERYYKEHSLITRLDGWSKAITDLPANAEELTTLIQGLLLHVGWAQSYNYTIPQNRNTELNLRTLPEMLQKLTQLNSSPLQLAREPAERLCCICRDFAVFLVAFLREKGVPARLRVGFAGYFADKNPEFWDHRLAEYWDHVEERWVLVDAQIDAVQLALLSHSLNPFDINTSSPFLTAGQVWQQCRAGQLNAERFGDAPDDKGMAPIRYALLHDFDALNKVEVLGFDAWHPLIDKPDNALSQEDLNFLDLVADATIHVNDEPDTLHDLYKSSDYGQTMLSKLSATVTVN